MAAMREWSEDELRLLDKGTKKWPQGVPKRYAQHSRVNVAVIGTAVSSTVSMAMPHIVSCSVTARVGAVSTEHPSPYHIASTPFYACHVVLPTRAAICSH